MNSRAYQFQLQAADAAAAAVAAVEAPVHAGGEGDEPEVTPKAALLFKIQAQGMADEPPATMGIFGSNAEAIKCPECPKWFASEKAMFGHLRKHPERGYKGATRPPPPPPPPAATAAVATGDNKKPPKKKVPPRKQETRAVVPASTAMAAAAEKTTKAWEDEAGELSTKCEWWPATAKRVRTPVAPVPAASSCSCSSEEEEAAKILLEMAAASSSLASSEIQQQQQQSSVEPLRRAPDGAVSGHRQIQMPFVEVPLLLLDHQTPASEAEQQLQIGQPENALVELSAESQTPAAAAGKQVTDLVITTTEAVLIVVPANSKKKKKPIFPNPSLDVSAGAGAGDKKQKAKKRRRVTTNPEQTAAAAEEEGGGAAVRTPPAARRIPSPASDRKRTCPTCGKSFPTHQALGGHMTSHAKGSKATTTANARHDELAKAQAMHNILARHRDQQSAGNGHVIVSASTGAGASVLQEEEPQPPPAPHVCGECGLEFRSGQSLGGHKRKHWRDPEKQQGKAAAVPVPAPRDFDLNELPAMEGQGEQQSALGITITRRQHMPARFKSVLPKWAVSVLKRNYRKEVSVSQRFVRPGLCYVGVRRPHNSIASSLLSVFLLVMSCCLVVVI